MHVRSWLSPYVRVRSIISLRIRCGGWGWGLVAARSCALHLNLRRRWSPHSSLLPSPVAGRAWSFPPVAFVAHLVFSTFEIQLNGSGDGQRIVAIENPCCGWGPGPGILVSCLSLSLSLSLSVRTYNAARQLAVFSPFAFLAWCFVCLRRFPIRARILRSQRKRKKKKKKKRVVIIKLRPWDWLRRHCSRRERKEGREEETC